MRYNTSCFISGLLAALMLPCAVAASPLVYTPVNPSFGGNPFNGSVLLGEANAQNHYKDKSASSSAFSGQQSLEDLFQTSLISKLQQQVFDAIGAGETGTSTVGNIRIDYRPGPNNTMIVTITGPTGATEISVPR